MRLRSVAIVCGLLASSAALGADSAWKVSKGDVRVVCPLTIGGSFEAKTSALGGTMSLVSPKPAAFSGELSVDLTTLDTGIDLRNEHLRSRYLETQKGAGFDRAILTDVKLGDVDAMTFQGKTVFTATLAVHGVKKPVTGEATVKRQGSSIRVDAAFPVMLPDYGIEKPRHLGIGVKDQVQVKVTLSAEPAGAQGQ